MQQYRVNYSLLIGLVIGTLVCSGAVYALWRFQIERKSGWLISEADKAYEERDYREAVRYYSQYLTVNSTDAAARIKYANALADVTELDDVTGEELNSALRNLEGTVRSPSISDMPEAKELRLRLVKLLGRDFVRRYQDAIEHLSYLIESDPNNAELQVLRANYLFRSGSFDDAVRYSYQLIGYDPEADAFDLEKATAPHDPQIYTNLAGFLRAKQNKPDLADRLMDQMVDVNPELVGAYLARGRYRSMIGEADAARDDVEKAYQLKPEDPEVLLLNAELAANNENYEKAAEFLATGKKLDPSDVRYYLSAASLQMKQKNYQEALSEIDEGVKKVKGPGMAPLLSFKFELQFQQRDVAGVRQTIEDLQKIRNIAPEYVELYEARLLLMEDKWYQAAAALNKLRPKFADVRPNVAMDIDHNLGLCYEKLGRPDLALEAFDSVLQQNPENEPARLGKQRALAQKGLAVPDAPFQKAVAAELEKPKGQQDWSRVNELLQTAATEQEWDEAMLKIRQAQLFAMREDFDGAKKALAEANKLSPKNPIVLRMLVQVTRLDPKAGPAKALELWNNVAKRFSDQPALQAHLRLDKADILIAMNAAQQNKDELKSELAGLMTGIDDWSVAQKVELWKGMAARYLSLGMGDEARQYLMLAAENQPHELPLRLMLFGLALDSNDDDGMKEAQDKILEIVGDKNDSAWQFTEARRQLSLVRRGQLSPESLDETRVLVNRALEQRPDWHDLHVLNAELALAAGDGLLALKHYDRAEQLGRPVPAAVAQHIKLLAMVGRFNDAGKLLDRIAEPLRLPLLGQLYPEILFRTNRAEEALKQARAAIEAEPTSPQNHYWYSQLLARLAGARDTNDERRKDLIAQATKSMRRAVELQPEFPEAWFALISYPMTTNDVEQAQAALREAQLVLSGDNLQMFLARSYEALGRWFDAETMYRALYEAAPNELPRAQQLAAFYLGNAYQRPDRQLKATPLVNKILRAGGEGKIPPADPNLTWARRMGATMLAGTGDYQKLLKAEKLLASNSQNGALSIEDKLAMADILKDRPEPVSRLKAVALLEEVAKLQPLNEAGEIALGELYYAVGGDWRKYASQMEKAIGRFPNSAAARDAYIRKLLNRGDQRSLEKADEHVKRLKQIAPKNPNTFELTVRLADKNGKQAQARAELVRLVPKFDEIKELTDPQAQMLTLLAGLLVELDDLDTAEKIYRELAARDPRFIPALASFLGSHRGVEQCFEKLHEVYTPERIPAILEVARSVVRQQRNKVGDKFDPQIQQWLDTGLRENPDSILLLIVQADLYDMQKRYDDAAAIYRKLLQRDDLVGLRRAIVLNNLAFLMSLAGSPAATDFDPMKLVQEAVQIMGPNSEILDTRAIVHIARRQYKQAIQDLELAVTDNPTASKYFHKAQAHLLTHENRAAVEAWEKAESLGLDRDAINLMEHELYEDMKTKIDQIRGASVTQADGIRKAG